MKSNTMTCLILGLFLSIPILNAADDVLFFEGSLEQVEAQAAREGKLYFVDFYASWCLPCKWMDETTFADKGVSSYLKENYVPAKVNIDNFDGYSYKEQYNVAVLPTMLIFNSSGQIVGRYEESLPPSKMMAILEKYNTPENRVKYEIPEPITETPTPVYEEPIEEIEAAPEYGWNDEVYREPATNEDNSQESSINQEEFSAIEENAETNPEIKIEASSIEEKSDVITDLGLYTFSVKKRAEKGYAVQVGVYGNYGNVMREAVRFQDNYGNETLVRIEKTNDKTVYRLMLGAFYSRSDAQDLVNTILENGGEALIKDLSNL